MRTKESSVDIVKAGIAIAVALAFLGPNVASIVRGVPLNNPPNQPDYPTPGKGATDVDIEKNLRFFCSDPDGDNMTAYIYFEDRDPPQRYIGKVGPFKGDTPYFEQGRMNYSTKYYWNVTVVDYYGAATNGPTWNFTTETRQQPNIPDYPIPDNHKTGVACDLPELKWRGGDTNEQEKVYYKVYFGTSSPPPLYGTTGLYPATQSFIPYPLSTVLSYSTTYYWNITAVDEYGLSRDGPIWDFTTEANKPPKVPGAPTPGNNTNAVSIINVALYWTGGDLGKHDTVTYQVYFGTSPSPPLNGTIGPFPSNQTTIGPYSLGTLAKETTYYWQIIAVDNNGATQVGPLWNFHTARYITVYVDDNFVDDPPNHKWNTIQKGIADAWPYDTVYVYNGNYTGPIAVDKKVSLIGESRENVIVGQITVTMSEVHIDNFTIHAGHMGLYLNNADSTVVTNCDFYASGMYGVYVESMNNHNFTNCNFYNSEYGFTLNTAGGDTVTNCNSYNNSCSGISSMSPNSHFVNCNVYGSKGTGFEITGDLSHCGAYDNRGTGFVVAGGVLTDCVASGNGGDGFSVYGGVITDCIAYDNRNGITIGGTKTTVTGCSFTNNNDSGIYISGNENIITNCCINGNHKYGINVSKAATKNKIYKNNISNSAGAAENAVVNATNPAKNTWDDDVGFGNFWDDYTEKYPDATNNGFVWDIAYTLSNNNKDRYPLVKPFVPGDTQPPVLNITAPTLGIYLFGKKLLIPYTKTMMLGGPFTIKADATDDLSGVAKVEFTLGSGELPDYTDFTAPYEWEINKTNSKVPFMVSLTLTVRAYDFSRLNTTATMKMTILYFGIR